jgi:hypothetical protein
MKILIIEGIYGRFTNYILTIMQSIYYSLEHNINYIKFDYQHKDYNYADIFKIQNYKYLSPAMSSAEPLSDTIIEQTSS